MKTDKKENGKQKRKKKKKKRKEKGENAQNPHPIKYSEFSNL